ncbi:MAG: 23S rRNA (guanosine(2251)-2'-O)-methyltransferase RlmB [Planctomycetaceae bacterium]|nr:23S rRNA (guanosine(2251)-2'-O)-methyltransferase RlmB [Planctomycetaceae bacterium]
MNSRKRRFSSRLAGNHQKSWLWGRHAVLETLRAGRWPVTELHVDAGLMPTDITEVQQLATSRDIPLEFNDAERLTELCQTYEHQGFLARMGEFPCEDLESLLLMASTLTNKSTQETPVLPASFVVCDRIQDAYNFGAILRSCDAMKLDGIVIGDRYQSAITPHVARSSAGAVNHQRIFRVPQLTVAVEMLKQSKYQIIAASEKSATTVWNCDFSQPTVMLIGSESTGVAPELLALCDTHVSIPMLGGVNSLNAAVAAGIVLYECRRQQLFPRVEPA